MVGLGKDVSVKFILGNSWLKSIGAVVGYGQDCLRVPLYPDVIRFPLSYKKPERGSAPVGHDSAATHRAAFANLSNLMPFVQVLSTFGRDCPCLDHANKLVNTLQKGLLNDKIPVRVVAAAACGTGEGSDLDPLLIT